MKVYDTRHESGSVTTQGTEETDRSEMGIKEKGG